MSKEAKKFGAGYERDAPDDRTYEEDPLVELARIVSGGPLYPRRRETEPEEAAPSEDLSDGKGPEEDAPEVEAVTPPVGTPQDPGRAPEDDVFAGDPTADLERELLAEFEASFAPPEPEPDSPEERQAAPDIEAAGYEPEPDEDDGPYADVGAEASVESGEVLPDTYDERDVEPSLEADEAEDRIAGYPLDAAVSDPVASRDDIPEDTAPEIELPAENESPAAALEAPEVFPEPNAAEPETAETNDVRVAPEPAEPEAAEPETTEPERPEPLDLASQLSAILGSRVTPTTARPVASRDEPSAPAIEGGSASLLARMRRGFEEPAPRKEPVVHEEPAAEDDAPAVEAFDEPEIDAAPPVETTSLDEEPAETTAPPIDLDDLEGALAAAVGEAIANDPEISKPRFEPSFEDEAPADLDLTPLPEIPDATVEEPAVEEPVAEDPGIDEPEADDAPEVITEAPSADDDVAWRGPDLRADSRYADDDDSAAYADDGRIEPGLDAEVPADEGIGDDGNIDAVEAALFPEVTAGEPYRIDERYAPEEDAEAPEAPDLTETTDEPGEGDAYPEIYAEAPRDGAAYEGSYDADGSPLAAEGREGVYEPAIYAETGSEDETDYPAEGYAEVEGYEDGEDDSREFVPREYRSDAYDPAFDDAALEPPRVAVDLDEAYGAPVAAGYEAEHYDETYHAEAGYAPDGDYADTDDIALAAEEAAPQYSGDDHQLPPHTEEELEASPADGERGRGMMVAAVVGGIVVLGLAGFLGYRFLAGEEASGPPPMIYADTGEVKVKPEEPQGTGEPERSKLIYDRVGGSGEPGEERLIVRTEEPVDPLAAEGETGVPEAEARGAVPRRVRTVVVRPDGTIVDQSDDAAPAAAAPVETVRIRPTTDDIGATADEAAADAGEGADTAEATDADLLAGNADTPEFSGEADVPRPKPGTELAALDTDEAAPAEATDDAEASGPAADEEPVASEAEETPAATDDTSSETDVASREPEPRQVQTEAPASRPATPAVPRNARLPEARPSTADSPVSPTARRVTTQPVRTQGRDIPPTNRGQTGPLDLTAAARGPAVTPPPSAPPSNAAEAAAATPATAAPPAGTYSVQVSSQRSEAQAQEAYKSLQSRYPQLFNNQNAMILRADLGDKGTYYRVRVGPMERGAADNFCSNLKSAGGDCFIRRN